MKSRKKNSLIFLLCGWLFIFFISLSTAWQLVVPAGSEAPDESQHLEIIDFLARNKRIPVFNKESELSPTTYTQGGRFDTAYYSMAYNSPLSYLPFAIFPQAQISAQDKTTLQGPRFVNGVFISLFVVFLFLALIELLPNRIFSAFTVALFIGLIPQIIYSSSYVNIEPVALFLSSLAMFLMFRTFKSSSKKFLLSFGLVLGLLALCKANYLLVVFYLVVIFLNGQISKKSTKKEKLTNILIILSAVVLIDSYWWMRNIVLFRDPIIINQMIPDIISKSPAWFVTPAKSGLNLFNIFQFAETDQVIFYGFYAYLGALNIVLPIMFYWAFYLNLGIAGLYAIYHSLRSKSNTFLVIFSLIVIFTGFMLFLNKNLTDFSPQGRHLFPLLIPMAVLISFGISKFQGAAKRYYIIAALALSGIANITAIIKLIKGYYVFGNSWALHSPAGRTYSEFRFSNLSLGNYSALAKKIFGELYIQQSIIFIISIILALVSIALMSKTLISIYKRNQ